MMKLVEVNTHHKRVTQLVEAIKAQSSGSNKKMVLIMIGTPRGKELESEIEEIGIKKIDLDDVNDGENEED